MIASHHYRIAVAILLCAMPASLGCAAIARPPAVAKEAPQRLLPLEGGRNFRDLGGYRTANGGHVRWHMLYRSGSMSGLTAADYAYLDKLGIAAVCDLRTVDERRVEPVNWGGAIKPDYWTRDYASMGGDLRRLLAPGTSANGAEVRIKMMALYGDLPISQKEGIREIFRRLLAGQVPLAFNCTAGKDRTGVAAALILSALGVPRKLIVEDYALTDKVIDYRKTAGNEAMMAAVARLPLDAQNALLRADPDYIGAMFDSLDQQYGSVQGYLAREMGVGPIELRRLRKMFVE